jgi:teichuronic acid biosynthesis glycosyltransferase TuaC
MRVLVITSIFPNTVEPLSSPFNRQQFAALRSMCEVDVLATIPWFPFAAALRRWSRSGRLAAVPRVDHIDGLPTRHPRTLYLPRIGRSMAAALYVASVLPEVMRYRRRVDVVLGSWAYPDGCAAVVLAHALGVPAVVKLHGSDLNVVARMPGPRRVLQAVLPRAARVVAVSRALAAAAADLGVEPARIDLVENGVDAAVFFPRDRRTARTSLGLPPDGRLLLYVGNLKESKGVLDLAAAFEAVAAAHPDVSLAIVGDGPERARCAAHARRVGARMALVGARPLAEIPLWMAACDAVVLPSWYEGTPNVVLEALACGRRVIATNVGGVPDLITCDAIGELVAPREPAALGEALARAARTDYDPATVAALGARGSWHDSATALCRVLERARAEGGRR